MLWVVLFLATGRVFACWCGWGVVDFLVFHIHVHYSCALPHHHPPQPGEAYRLLEEQLACDVERTPSTYSHLLEHVERNGATSNPLLLPLLQHMQADGMSLDQVRRAHMASNERGGGRQQRQHHHQSPQRAVMDPTGMYAPRPMGSLSPQHQQVCVLCMCVVYVCVVYVCVVYVQCTFVVHCIVTSLLHAITQAMPQNLNFQELLHLAQQQQPAPVQPLLAPGAHMNRGDVMSHHATAQALGLTMTLPDMQHGMFLKFHHVVVAVYGGCTIPLHTHTESTWATGTLSSLHGHSFVGTATPLYTAGM